MSNTTTDTRPDLIQLRNIAQSYDNGQTYIIDNINITIKKPSEPQIITLIGPSGCGKSTLLRYIAGLQKPTKGDVLLYGRPRTEQDRIGMVFQRYSSFPWMTVLENVALGLKFKGIGRKERLERARKMLQIVGLEGHEKKLAMPPILSGGQLQRVAVARSLLVNNEILLMDEPFGALDTQTRTYMQDFLINVWEQVHPTIVLVTHDISEAVYLSDDIYIMRPTPSTIIEHIKVDLPYERNRDIKRDKTFLNLTHYIEDILFKFNK